MPPNSDYAGVEKKMIGACVSLKTNSVNILFGFRLGCGGNYYVNHMLHIAK